MAIHCELLSDGESQEVKEMLSTKDVSNRALEMIFMVLQSSYKKRNMQFIKNIYWSFRNWYDPRYNKKWIREAKAVIAEIDELVLIYDEQNKHRKTTPSVATEHSLHRGSA